MDKYIVSDLIMESAFFNRGREEKCYAVKDRTEKKIGDFKVIEITVDDESLGYRKGNYVTVCAPELCLMERKKKRLLSSVLSGEILKLLFRSVGKSCGDGFSVLVAGIGNRGITPDAIGPMTSDRINVTRHIKKMNPTAFSKMGGYCVSAISCGVMGETGMDTAEILRGVVSNIRPDAIIAVDALAARECENLGAVIQMSDSGIVPGAGVGNRRISVDRQSLGIPVIAIGVPTVVSAATLIKDSLTKEGIFLDSRAEEALESRKNFFVAPKECDLLAECASEIIADAINGSLTVI